VSDARVLHMLERRVADAARAGYLREVAERRAACAPHGVQCWVFEHVAEPGRFVEFVEARDQATLDRVLVTTAAGGSQWRSVELG
jgi:hypothetical protein